MMPRYIDADAAIDAARKSPVGRMMIKKNNLDGWLLGLPAADVAPLRHGRWVYGENDGQDGWYCSECHFFIPWYYDWYGLDNIDFIKDFHACPHCSAKMVTYTGAKMDGGDGE